MSKKIYSRTVTQGKHTFLDRIQVEDQDGKQFVTAHSTIASKGNLISTEPHQVAGIVADLIDGKGECPYTLEQ